MRDDTIFDFPCSTTFRDAYREQRRPNLPACGRHSDEQEMLDYIHALEDENHRLRLALDLAGRPVTASRREPTIVHEPDAIMVGPL
jgi:hypothetical protein